MSAIKAVLLGIIFYSLYCGRYIRLITFEIYYPVEFLSSTAPAPRCNPSGVVASARFSQTLSQGFNGTTLPKLRTVDQYQPALARRRWLIRLECHAFCLPFAMSAVLPPLVKPPEGGRFYLLNSFPKVPRFRSYRGVIQNCPPL